MSKHSVYISEPVEEIIGFLSDESFHGKKNYSGSINTGLSVLDQLMKKSKPKLTDQEWHILYNTYAGCAIEFNMPVRIASDVMDDAGVYDITKMDSTTANLIEKVAGMSSFEQVAILWEVKRFWQTGQYEAQNVQDILVNEVVKASARNSVIDNDSLSELADYAEREVYGNQVDENPDLTSEERTGAIQYVIENALLIFEKALAKQEDELSTGYRFESKSSIEDFVFTEDLLDKFNLIEEESDDWQAARDMQHGMVDTLAVKYGVE